MAGMLEVLVRHTHSRWQEINPKKIEGPVTLMKFFRVQRLGPCWEIYK